MSRLVTRSSQEAKCRATATGFIVVVVFINCLLYCIGVLLAPLLSACCFFGCCVQVCVCVCVCVCVVILFSLCHCCVVFCTFCESLLLLVVTFYCCCCVSCDITVAWCTFISVWITVSLLCCAAHCVDMSRYVCFDADLQCRAWCSGQHVTWTCAGAIRLVFLLTRNMYGEELLIK